MDERKMILEIESEYGVKYESVEEFSKSLFGDVYYNAFKMTERVIDVNSKYTEGKHERLYNIIAFMGERGTGKTSVMRSFVEALQTGEQESYEKFFERYAGVEIRKRDASFLNNTEFVALENIDASLLEAKEDIFESVLAKMMAKFMEATEKKSGKDRIRFQDADLLREFEEMYKSKRNMNDKEQDHYGYGVSPVELLRNLSGSLALRDKFCRFVPDFLRAVSDNSKENKFLVICIDDLDINKENGFAMLEQIHRYFMVPQVLIYLAVSEEQLMDICKNHFDGVYRGSERLARAYTDKVLPFSQRIYMPVLLAKKSGIKIGTKTIQKNRDGDTNDYTIKIMILWKIAHRTNICFDGCGLKTHFYEPEDIRALTNLYSFLDSMKKLDMSKCRLYARTEKGVEEDEKIKRANNSFLEILDFNITNVLDDIRNRMANDKLDEGQIKALWRIYKTDPMRQGEDVLSYISQRVEDTNFKNDLEFFKKYNIGEILRGIYVLGRIMKEEKPMLHCVMALLSTLMTRLYMHSLYEATEEARQHNYEILQSYLSDSVVGSWGNYMSPLLNMEVEYGLHQKYEIGYINVINMDDDMEITTVPNTEYTAFLENLKEQDIVKELEIMLMFFVNWGNGKKGTNCILEMEQIEMPQDNRNEREEGEAKHNLQNGIIRIKCKNERITFDRWGFVINSARYVEYFAQIHEALCDAIIECFNIDEESTEVKMIKETIEEKSLYQDYKQWDKQYGYAVIPFYNIDILYNIEKRIKEENEKLYPNGIEKEMIFESILQDYDLLEEHLEKEDEFYEDKYSKNRGYEYKRFQEIYNMCPFIKYVREKRGKLTEIMNGFVHAQAVIADYTRGPARELLSEIGEY